MSLLTSDIMRICAIVICFASLMVPIYGIDTNAYQTCQKDPKTRIAQEDLEKVRNGEEVDKSLIGPHILCVTTKFGFQNEEGKINKTYLRVILSQFFFDEIELNKIVEKTAVEKDDPQDTAIALYKNLNEITDRISRRKNN